MSELFKLIVVLLEVRMALKSDEKLCLLGVSVHGDSFCPDLLESGIVVSKSGVKRRENLPNEIFGRLDTSRYCISEGVELDCLMVLEDLLAEVHVELGLSLVGYVDLVWVLAGCLGFATGLICSVFHFSLIGTRNL